MDIGALAPVDRHIEGVVEMVLDATANGHASVESISRRPPPIV